MKKLTVFYLCSLIFALSSCKPKQIITEKTYTDTLIITQQVVTTPTRPDSALLDVLFRCDSLNRVMMVELDTKNTAGIRNDVQFKGGRLTVATIKPADSIRTVQTNVYRRIREVQKQLKIYNITKTIYRTKKIHVWGWLDWLGLFFVAYISIFISIKIKNKTKSWQQTTKDWLS
jgi:hypothetical protein